MTKKYSGSKYPSRYSDSDVHAGQYIVEILCENRAKSLQIELPNKFWLLSNWKQFYIVQMKFVSQIRAKYQSEEFDRFFIQFVRKNHIWSLGPKSKWAVDKMESEYLKEQSRPEEKKSLEGVKDASWAPKKQSDIEQTYDF